MYCGGLSTPFTYFLYDDQILKQNPSLNRKNYLTQLTISKKFEIHLSGAKIIYRSNPTEIVNLLKGKINLSINANIHTSDSLTSVLQQ
ncbi:unnamed protein product [Didymodactylos carnosus]|uniref:Uncharacterized protein n=1 Tax=Didymodactylos carnosus TaxID=1234261 RepID=A0A814C743_9BILA|nr:unnamed protein product [Didymodactylos carnosus]CAF1100026.1 unnamed protein product [Didymodactylos carnosus]CAF3716792.1 unnamed protein product [Didymodactylos carnosus]CAF3861486.1 unnamed protein product [Didymodactylos carnosus]